MPSGKVHNVGVIALAAALGSHYPLIGAGAALGIILTPDLDLAENEHARNLWFGYWWPYGRVLNHRSRLSHLPVVGTFGRLAYVLWPIWLLSWFGWHRIWMPPWELVVGLALADLLHGVADLVIHPLMRWVGMKP